MGHMTFDQMKNEVALTVRDINDEVRLNQFVNWGLQDLTSYLKLDEQLVRASFPITEDDFSYAAPADLIGVRTIEIGGTKLKLMHRELARGEDSGGDAEAEEFEPGKPQFYMRRGVDIIIWPTPDDDYEGYIEYSKSPALITSGSATTTLQPMWDMAIVRFALHYGFAHKGDVQKAEFWLNSAIRYINSRLTDKDWSKDNPKEGLQVAWDHDDLGVRNPPHV